MDVYLDYNATAPMRPEVIEAVTAALALGGNPSSVHEPGRRARRVIEDAREEVAALIQAAPEDIVFTSGGTESNALALYGAGRERILASAVEHASVLGNAACDLVPVDGNGVVDLAALESMLDSRPALVSVMLANNETGVIQPVAEAAEIAHRYGALVHCDAVQAAGKIPVDVTALGADLLSLAAHKLAGPKGVGALYVAPHVELRPLFAGGGQERRRRSGTENLSGIAGFGVAAKLARDHIGDYANLARLRDALEARVLKIAPGAIVFGSAAPRLANTALISMPDVASEKQVIAFDLDGIAVSAGSACSSGKIEPSRVLRAMGYEMGVANTAVRASLGWRTSEDDVTRFIEVWGRIYAARRGESRAPAA